MGNIVGTIYFQNTDKNTKNEILNKLKRLSNEHNISSTNNGNNCIIDSIKQFPNHFSVEIVGLSILLRGENGCRNKIKSFLFDAEKYLKHKNIIFESDISYYPI